jgi:hypothetical protein
MPSSSEPEPEPASDPRPRPGTEPGLGPDRDAGDHDLDERAEIERLRTEVAELRAAGGDPGGRRRFGSARGRRRPGAGRWALSLALVVLASLLAVVAVVARYARSELLDTDRYVATVSPLAEDPDVQQAIGRVVTREIFTRLDVEQLAEDALAQLTELGAPELVVSLATPIADQVEGFVRDEVDSALASDSFAQLWDQANAAAHAQVVAVLTGEVEGAVSFDDGAVTVDLGAVVAAVKERLVDRGFTLAQNIPEVDTTFTLVESDGLDSAQAWVRRLDRAATILPWIILVLAGAAVLVAPDRRRGLVAVAVGLGVAMVLLAVSLALARSWYLDNGTPRNLTPEAAVGVVGTLLVPLRTAMRAVLVLALVVALAGVLAGPSGLARSVRSFAGRVRSLARDRVEGERAPSPVEAWVGAHKPVLRLGIVALAVLVLAFWTYPSGATVLVTALTVLAALALVELLGWAGTGVPPSEPAPG